MVRAGAGSCHPPVAIGDPYFTGPPRHGGGCMWRSARSDRLIWVAFMRCARKRCQVLVPLPRVAKNTSARGGLRSLLRRAEF